MASVASVGTTPRNSNGREDAAARKATAIAVVDPCILILTPGFAGRMLLSVEQPPARQPGLGRILHLPPGPHLPIILGRLRGEMDLTPYLTRVWRRVCVMSVISDMSDGRKR